LPHIDLVLLLTLAIALVFNYLNGYIASSSLVATLIASRALGQRQALLLASVGEFAGPLIFGSAVAATIGRDFVDSSALPISAVLAMLIGAVSWLLITYRLGLPVSPSHALVGGIVGAAIAANGPGTIYMSGLIKIVASLIVAPIISMISGWTFMELILILAKGTTPGVNTYFKRAQLITSALLAVSQGSNDAQKTIGVITMALVISGEQAAFVVPFWVILVSALVIALGVLSGGTRTIHTIASKFYRIRPVHGFATQTISATVVLIAGFLGAPVSTGQVVSSSLVGVGSAERLSKVRWDMAANLVVAWLLTIPAAAIFSAGVYLLMRFAMM
jgi:PiT family inorganic phosphate transporter